MKYVAAFFFRHCKEQRDAAIQRLSQHSGLPRSLRSLAMMGEKFFGMTMVVIFAVLLAGCTPPALGNLQNIGRESDPTRFYTLSSTAQGVPEGAAAMPYVVLGIGPVSVSDYLDRSQIVVRESPNQLSLAEFDRWAGSPAKELQRVLGADLATLLGTERVVAYPWKSSIAPDMSVEVTVERFEYGEGKVWLVASWQVFADNGREAVAFRRSTFSRESPADYDAISAELSGLAGELAGEIAAAIRAGYRQDANR